MKKRDLAYDASGLIRYLTRLDLLPSPYGPPRPLIEYLMRGEDVAAFACENFNSSSLADHARELECDSSAANHRIFPVWVHGCVSIKASPDEFEGSYDGALALGHRLMELGGVERNRYILVVHRDSGHVHVHFLYSRVDAKGNLRERERKYPKYMAEEACAILAHQFGYGLEPGHLSRVIPAGVLDLASGRVTCDLNLNPNVAACKLRQLARMKTRGDRLRTLALVAHHLAAGSLALFRSELAEHGISYRASGSSGSEFEDADGEIRTCSDVDPRLSRGKIKIEGVSACLPEEPDWIKAKVARRRRELGRTKVPKANPEREWERFSAARDQLPDGREHSSETEWCDHDVRRAFREDRRGRPHKRCAPGHWPNDATAQGAFGASTISRRRFSPKLNETVYQRIEQPWQTEFWRSGNLVATVRQDRMTIYSKNQDDLREALRAAHRAWGEVEVFGNRKFKQQIVKLAAELDVPLANPELQTPLAHARALRDTERLHRELLLDRLSKPPPTIEIANSAEAHETAEPHSDEVGRMEVAPQKDAPLEQPLRSEHPAATVSKSVKNPIIAPAIVIGSGNGKTLPADEHFVPINKHQPSANAATPAAPAAAGAPTSESRAIVQAAPASQPFEGSQPAPAEQSPGARGQRDTLQHYWKTGTRYPIHQTHDNGRSIFLLPARTARHFGISEQDQAQPRFQDLLRSMYRQQEEEHAQIIAAVKASEANLRQKQSLRGDVSYSLNSSDETIVRLYGRHALNPLLQGKLDLAWKDLRARSLHKIKSAEKARPNEADQDTGAAASTDLSPYGRLARHLAAGVSGDPAGAAGGSASATAPGAGGLEDRRELAPEPASQDATGAEQSQSAPLPEACSALHPEPPGEPGPRTAGAPEASCASALVENAHRIIPRASKAPAQPPDQERREQPVRPSQRTSGLGSDADAISVPSPIEAEQAVTPFPWTKAERDELLVPRRVGPDGVMRPVEVRKAPSSPQDRANVRRTEPRNIKEAPSNADPRNEASKAAQAAQERGEGGTSSPGRPG
jgi:hypothetical protein